MVVAFTLLLLTANAFAQQIQWMKQLSGNSPAQSTGHDLAMDANGNTYVAGAFGGTINFGGGTQMTATGVSDFFYVKYDPNGNLLFAKQIGQSNGYVSATGVSLFTDASSNVFLYVYGYFTSTNGQLITVNFDPMGSSAGNLTMVDYIGDAFVSKYNSSGVFQWAQRVANTDANNTGGGKIAIDGSGNAYIVSGVQFGTPYLRKLAAATGTQVWATAVGLNVHNIAVSASTVFIVGAGLSGSRPIAWYDLNGTFQGSNGNTLYNYESVAIGSDGQIYVAGGNVIGDGTTNVAIEKYPVISNAATSWASILTMVLQGRRLIFHLSTTQSIAKTRKLS